jgi:hypothetical protein
MINIIGSLTLIFLIVECSALTISPKKVPTTIRESQSKMYPQVQKLSWSLENENYECTFHQAGIEYSVVWSPSAMPLEIEIEVQLSEIPAIIKDYIQKNHPGKKPKEVAKNTLASGVIQYEIEINGKDYLFTESGSPIKPEKQ